MIAASETLVLKLRRLRSENQFSVIFKDVNEMVDVHDLEPVVVPWCDDLPKDTVEKVQFM